MNNLPGLNASGLARLYKKDGRNTAIHYHADDRPAAVAHLRAVILEPTGNRAAAFWAITNTRTHLTEWYAVQTGTPRYVTKLFASILDRTAYDATRHGIKTSDYLDDYRQAMDAADIPANQRPAVYQIHV